MEKQTVTWRVLPWVTNDAYTNMAIDKTIVESVASGGLPTIRFYQWEDKGAISLGRPQTLEDVDIDFCKQHGISYVRRFTGGRAMYHDPLDITYTIAAPTWLYRTRLQLTSETSRAIMLFLEELGFTDVCYTGNSSITTKGKKISGSAPHYEKRNAILQHGSVFYNVLDYDVLGIMFKQDKQLVQQRTTSILTEKPTLTKEDVFALFQNSFFRHLGHDLLDYRFEYFFGELTIEEKQRNKELAEEYRSLQWMQEGTLPSGICTINWGNYPALREHLPKDLQERLLDRGTD